MVNLVQLMCKKWFSLVEISEKSTDLAQSIKCGIDFFQNFALQNSNKCALVERSSYLSLASEILNSAISRQSSEVDEVVARTLYTLSQLCGSGF